MGAAIGLVRQCPAPARCRRDTVSVKMSVAGTGDHLDATSTVWYHRRWPSCRSSASPRSVVGSSRKLYVNWSYVGGRLLPLLLYGPGDQGTETTLVRDAPDQGALVWGEGHERWFMALPFTLRYPSSPAGRRSIPTACWSVRST